LAESLADELIIRVGPGLRSVAGVAFVVVCAVNVAITSGVCLLVDLRRRVT
jgi:hypothetical protein